MLLMESARILKDVTGENTYCSRAISRQPPRSWSQLPITNYQLPFTNSSQDTRIGFSLNCHYASDLYHNPLCRGTLSSLAETQQHEISNHHSMRYALPSGFIKAPAARR